MVHDAVGYRMVPKDTEWYSMIQNGTKRYRMVPKDTEWYQKIQNGTKRYSMVPKDTYDTV